MEGARRHVWISGYSFAICCVYGDVLIYHVVKYGGIVGIQCRRCRIWIFVLARIANILGLSSCTSFYYIYALLHCILINDIIFLYWYGILIVSFSYLVEKLYVVLYSCMLYCIYLLFLRPCLSSCHFYLIYL
jgi:hypothetical protein